ncbi:hypothetical protein ACOMHN_006495 [Nucella lapillus]
MLPIPEEIKGKLVKALDDENDVDDATVVEMVSFLEKYPITRATLEETKIGKMVNDLRRKIKNEKLAKRIKQLVRNWKKILDETPVNGGIPGPTHPALSQLRSSPAVSPALSRVSSSGRLVSPAQGSVSPAPGKPGGTPKQAGKKNASPALAAGYRPGHRKALSPGAGTNGVAAAASTSRVASPALSSGSSRMASPALSGGPSSRMASPALSGGPSSRMASPALSGGHARMASPALSGGHARMASPALSGGHARMASPALSGGPSRMASPVLAARTASPTVSRRVVSPAVSGRPESKMAAGRVASPAVPGRVKSPAVLPPLGQQGKGKVSPLLTPGQSPELQSPFSRKHGDKSRLRKVASTSEISNVDNRTMSSFHSERHLDRLGGEVDKGRQDLDEESSCRSSRAGGSDHAHPHNHSNKTAVSLNSNNSNSKDQRELSKTNMANRKRARELSASPPEESTKRTRLETSSLSANSHRHSKVINGYTPKSSKKHIAALETPKDNTVTSTLSVHSKQVLSPHLSTTASEENLSLSHVHSDSFLMHQESTESNLSSQSFDRPSRDRHKVKTTEQLIEELQKKNNGSKIGHSIMAKLRTHQIEQEQDVPGSVLPVGMKPRGKRGRPRKSDIPVPPPTLSKVKSELVERFLSTSDPTSSVDDYSPFKDDLLPDPGQPGAEPGAEAEPCKSLYSKDNLDLASTSRQDVSELAPRQKNGRSALSPSPPVPSTSQTTERTGSALTLEEIYAQLPPVDDDIDWDAVDFYELPEPTPVTEERVEHLHTERLPGVNGLYDLNGDWTSWQQVLTLPSYEGNPLHILPYVDLDN